MHDIVTMSDAAVNLHETFCTRCYLGVLTEGDGGGPESNLRRIVYQYLTRPPLLGFGGAWQVAARNAHNGGLSACLARERAYRWTRRPTARRVAGARGR